MSLSFNEIEALALKAARGAGTSWGLAEEAAFAARWLAERGLDWAAALAVRCEARIGDALTLEADAMQGEALCPLRVGAYLADAGMPDRAFHVRDVVAPLLLLPFMARAEASAPVQVHVSPDIRFWISDKWLLAPSSLGPFPMRATVAIKPGAAPAEATSVPLRDRPIPSADALIAVLTAFEHRTYVPATAQSRLAGAGAGLSDND